MGSGKPNLPSIAGTSSDDIETQGAVNSLILDYYKKFGKKRDLEQFFSLSTANSDIKDTSGLFWRRMKSENDSSDSVEHISESAAQELCRISIRCSMPEPSSSQLDDPKIEIQSPQAISPPIITEDAPGDISQQSDDDLLKSDDNHSQKSFDPLLDLSSHKPQSPTSSVTSQRKLEWDSLADVGYAYGSECKTSNSNLSTLERLALKQQYTNNDTKQDIGSPNCHSTPVDENENKPKTKKNIGRSTKITKRDVDFVEVNMPHSSQTNPQTIQVNLTKHFSFNVEKNGGVTVDNVQRDVKVSPGRDIKTSETSHSPIDKEIQTSLLRSVGCKEKNQAITPRKFPVMISLNTCRKKLRRKKSTAIRRRLRAKRKGYENRENPSQEKSGGQLSEAESFEYMPGHIYNQNQLKGDTDNKAKPKNNSIIGNKSSLESSGGLTTDSSKGSKHSFTKDLEKCIAVLNLTLQKQYDEGEIKKKLIKEIVHRLLNSKYRDDETTTDFLSGLSFNSKKIGFNENNTTTSTSDANNTDSGKRVRPRKSILRMDKFDSKIVASTSQSAPNLLTATSVENININSAKIKSSNCESDDSSRGKTLSDNLMPPSDGQHKTSSEELYLKYLEALRREESYKIHLKDKELLLKQKLGSSDTGLKSSMPHKPKINNKLRDLIKDLTRNNYDDGSGDASKLEDGSISNRNVEQCVEPARSQKSHSVFTLSSSHSESQKQQNVKKKMQFNRDHRDIGSGTNHYCCCPHHFVKSGIEYCDSSVQMNIKYQYEDEFNDKLNQDHRKKCPYCQQCDSNFKNIECNNLNTHTKHCCEECQSNAIGNKTIDASFPICRQVTSHVTSSDTENGICDPRTNSKMLSFKCIGDENRVCLCKDRPISSTKEHLKLNKDTNHIKNVDVSSNVVNADLASAGFFKSSERDDIRLIRAPRHTDNVSTSTNSNKNSSSRKHSKSSQTNLLMEMLSKKGNTSSSEPRNLCKLPRRAVGSEIRKEKIIIHEATRCLQTEISIDPNVSGTSLSDYVTIVDNCAALIGEQSREVIVDTLDDKKTFSNVYTSSESGNFLFKSEDGYFQDEIKDSDINIIESKDSNFAQTSVTPNDYTIPIKGTNITLYMSLASSETKQNIEKVNQNIGTEEVFIEEKGTGIDTECAKSVQCSDSPLRAKNETASSADYSSNKSSKKSRSSPRKYYQSNLSPTRSPQRNTFPKVVHLDDKKQLRRANTDTGKLKKRLAQVESLHESMVPTNDSQSKSNNNNTSMSQEPQINIDRIILKSGDTHNKRNTTDTKEIGIQKDLSDYILKKPDMSTKSVGSEFVNPVMCLGVSCQTDFEENHRDIVPQMTQTQDNLQNSHKPQESPFQGQVSVLMNKNQCINYGCTHVCECEIEKTSQESIPKEKTQERSEQEGEPQSGPDRESNDFSDPIITIIQDITRRYSKGDITKIKKKKCFKEIVSVLNYLLETEESTDQEPDSNGSKKSFSFKVSNNDHDNAKKQPTMLYKCCVNKKSSKSESPLRCDNPNKKTLRNLENEFKTNKCDKSVQLSSKSTSKCTESSDLPGSTDQPSTSDSTACKILNKIKKECEKYHLRRKCGRKCEISSSTSVNCDKCKKVRHCGCRHKCKRLKIDKIQKKCVAYNLILQTSESMLSEETVCDKRRPLPNVVIKVPKRKDKFRSETCKDTFYKIEKGLKSNCSPRAQRPSCHNDSEISSNDDFIRTQQCTVREYLERNRPDFVERSDERQNCLKFINQMRAKERTAQRDLLSLRMFQEQDMTKLTTEQLQDLAKQMGFDLRRKKAAPKFINEREMKQHSENIYKTLPEVVQRKEDEKKENIKKTNLLMAQIFKKNLQKKTLRGSVNLSNYSTVIKI